MTDWAGAWLAQMIAYGLPTPVREYAGIPGRRYRFDFCWPEFKVAAEFEGGTFVRGRHTNPLGYAADCEKYNLAALEGWRVIRATKQHVQSGAAIRWLCRALGRDA